MEWKKSVYATRDITHKRKFIRYFCANEKIVDIWSTDDKQMWFCYALTVNHIMWRYTFDFSGDNVEYKMDLFKTF